MVNYKNSKVLSFGKLNHTYGGENTFLFPTTLSKSICRAYIMQKYKKINFGLIPDDDKTKILYKNLQMIERIEPNNIYVYVVDENPNINNKTEFNQYFNFLQFMITTPIIDIIKQNKPNIQNSTLTRYTDNIIHLMKILDTNNRLFFFDTSNVLNYIKNVSNWSNETEKNYLKSIIAYIPQKNNSYTIYNTELLQLINIAQNQRDKNEKTKKQTAKWIDYKEILKRYDELFKNGIQNARGVLSSKTIQNISYELVVSSFYVGVYFAPYRVMELQHLKIQNINKNVDNYIDFENHTIVLNIYKTSRDYGKRIQHIPNKLYKILNKYKIELLKHYPNATYLLSNDDILPTYYSICKVLENLFGCSPSLLRTIYVSNLHETGKLITNEQIKNTANEMRNSQTVLLSYRKIGNNENIDED